MPSFKYLLERSAFGVCTYLGERMKMSRRCRMYFIYLTFAALGSPILVYLFAAFWLNIRRYIKDNHKVVWK